MAVPPAKTQISLGIRPVWSESLLSAWKKLGSLATQCPGWSESSLGALSFYWFCHVMAHILTSPRQFLCPVYCGCIGWTCSQGCLQSDHPLWRHLKKRQYNYKNDPKFYDRQVWANSVDPDQTRAHEGAVWSGWMDELGFYVPSTVFQSFRDDGRMNMKGSV